MAKWAEQGACLDGIDGPQAPALREEDMVEMPGGLAPLSDRATGQPAGHR